MTDEEWRPIQGWEDRYEVSSYGNVKSLKTGPLRPGTTKSGYHVVSLCRDGKSTTLNVHRLVAEAFLPNPEGYPLVRHLNDIGTQNQVDNLAWGTYSRNRRDAVESGAYINQYANATHCKRGHRFSEENTYLIPSGGRACKTCRAMHNVNNRNKKKEGPKND